MIKFEKFTLDNGLKVIFHQDKNTPLAAINILYDVGAKDEHPEKTGFAHLFEHLMFGGSANIPSFDRPLQEAGGNNNAFTNNDFTNYYITLPKENIETALWLESDRMLSLAFTDKSLEVQRKVVIEEFKQNYLNQPYGDIWLLLRPLVFKKHPYQWATIGKEISHIENATMADVKSFFFNHYAPNNAILCIAGNYELNYIKNIVNKWFGGIEKRIVRNRNLPKEPIQTEERKLEVVRNIPVNSYHRVYHMCKRDDQGFYAADLLSDILSNGESSRLYQNLVKDKELFNNIDAYLTGEIESGLFIISGKLNNGVSYNTIEDAIDNELNMIINDHITDYELQKVKNKIESKQIFGETDILNKAMGLSYFELLRDVEEINTEVSKYNLVSTENIKEKARKIFRPENCSKLYYKSEQ